MVSQNWFSGPAVNVLDFKSHSCGFKSHKKPGFLWCKFAFVCYRHKSLLDNELWNVSTKTKLFHVFSVCHVLTLSGSICSMSLSRAGMKLGARWQFWKKTHFPLSIALLIIASALGPCKWKYYLSSVPRRFDSEMIHWYLCFIAG